MRSRHRLREPGRDFKPGVGEVGRDEEQVVTERKGEK